MSGINDVQRKHISALEPYLEQIAEFLNKKLKVDKSLPSAEIHKGVGIPVSLSVFKSGFSACVKFGLLTQLESRGRGGFKRPGTVKVVKVDLDSAQAVVESKPRAKRKAAEPSSPQVSRIPSEQVGTIIQVTDTIRLRAGRHNWTYQKLNGETWSSQKYWPDLQSALRLCAKHMFEQGIRASGTVAGSVDELIELVNQTEQRIVNLLEGKERVLDEAPDDEEEAA